MVLGCAAGIAGVCCAKQVPWEPKGIAVGNNGWWKVTRPKNILISYKCVVFPAEIPKSRRRSGHADKAAEIFMVFYIEDFIAGAISSRQQNLMEDAPESFQPVLHGEPWHAKLLAM